ncbi:hypothetical protein [Chitinophaga sp. YR627]|nr:hypothetical protein [Chitinophaga sp. YR627]
MMKISQGNTGIYTWKKFPGSINREKVRESMEIIYDIGTIIPNWGWVG